MLGECNCMATEVGSRQAITQCVGWKLKLVYDSCLSHMQYSLVNFDPGLIPGKEARGYEHCMYIWLSSTEMDVSRVDDSPLGMRCTCTQVASSVTHSP